MVILKVDALCNVGDDVWVIDTHSENHKSITCRQVKKIEVEIYGPNYTKSYYYLEGMPCGYASDEIFMSAAEAALSLTQEENNDY